MEQLVPLLGIVSALAIGVVSPGPSFIMVARVAVSASRHSGIAVSLALGLGGVIFAVGALSGLHAILLAVPALYVGLEALGGLYLCSLGYRILLCARQPLLFDGKVMHEDPSCHRSFLLGVTTQISNPKTAIVYASVFAAFLPSTYTVAFALSLICAVFLVESGWYAIVAVLLSSPGPRRTYLRCKAWVDRTTGAVMLGLGFKLTDSAHRG